MSSEAGNVRMLPLFRTGACPSGQTVAMTTDVPLVLLAAGLGTRYGGVKPLAPVGPCGEPLLYMALQQASAAGFARAVVVVGAASSLPIREALQGRWRPALPVSFERQDSIGPERGRPRGTVAAVLAAGEHGDVVIANGDDLYGVCGLRTALNWTAQHTGGDAAGVFYPVGPTVLAPGVDNGVSRALPTVVDGRLTGIAEQRDVHRLAGTVRLADGTVLADDQPVSMNLWCLRQQALIKLRQALDRFVEASGPDAVSEYGLPEALADLATEMHIDALITRSPWHGVTYARDVEYVRVALIAEQS